MVFFNFYLIYFFDLWKVPPFRGSSRVTRGTGSQVTKNIKGGTLTNLYTQILYHGVMNWFVVRSIRYLHKTSTLITNIIQRKLISSNDTCRTQPKQVSRLTQLLFFDSTESLLFLRWSFDFEVEDGLKGRVVWWIPKVQIFGCGKKLD